MRQDLGQGLEDALETRMMMQIFPKCCNVSFEQTLFFKFKIKILDRWRHQKRLWRHLFDLINFWFGAKTLIDRQPRRFIYPKDGGRFDAPKIHVFAHLLRKCFTGKPKVRLRPPNPQFMGVKMAFIYPKDGMDKNCLKSFSGVHWTMKWRRQ